MKIIEECFGVICPACNGSYDTGTMAAILLEKDLRTLNYEKREALLWEIAKSSAVAPHDNEKAWGLLTELMALNVDRDGSNAVAIIEGS